MKWKCYIPGKEGTIWEGGFYPLTMEFTEVGRWVLHPAMADGDGPDVSPAQKCGEMGDGCRQCLRFLRLTGE